MPKTLIEQLTTIYDDKRRFAAERFYLEITEAICGRMNESDMSRAELAEQLRRFGYKATAASVTRMLFDPHALRLDKLATILWILDVVAEFKLHTDMSFANRTDAEIDHA